MIGPYSSESNGLASGDAAHVAGVLTEVSAAGLPLAGAMRAAAEQASGPSAQALRGLADDLERGTPLDQALSQRRVQLPPYMHGLLTAAMGAGDVGGALIDLIEHRQTQRDLWGMIAVSLAYPTAVLAIALLVFGLFDALVLHDLMRLYSEFQFGFNGPLFGEPEKISQAWMWVSRGAIWSLAGLCALVAAALAMARLVLGPKGPPAVMARLPLIGPLWRLSAAADVSRMLSMLLAREAPLTQALSLTAGAAPDAAIARSCGRLARQVEEGRPLAAAMAAAPEWPASIVPLVHWGERTGELADAFRTGAEMFDSRARLRAAVLRTVLPPILLIMVGLLALLFIAALLAPMIKMIQNLA